MAEAMQPDPAPVPPAKVEKFDRTYTAYNPDPYEGPVTAILDTIPDPAAP